jgi:tetratricopeptide (TPR) repeat protein
VQKPLASNVNAPGGKVVVAESIGTIIISPSGQEYRRVFVGVPAPGQPLVGRDDALADLRGELIAGGLVARTGLPGVGKTALALAVVRDAAILSHFEGGVLWAGLGPIADVTSVLGRWGTMLQLDLSAEATVADRAQRLHDHLQTVVPGKPFLIVIDDAWKWEDLAPFRVFAEPGNVLLLTARDVELARRFTQQRPSTIKELDETASVALLERLCPEAMIDPEGLRELARTAGGLPLALVLIGGELAANTGLEQWVRVAIRRLKAAQAQLALVDYQTRPGMQEVSPTLQVIVEMSLSALPDDGARAAFAQLAVFAAKPADFSREAALAVWGLQEQEGDRCLRLLSQRNLLEITSGGRFTLHQLLTQVARVRLGERHNKVSERHFTYYLDLVDLNRDDWRTIELDLVQIRQARKWASTTPEPGARVLELLSAIRVYMERRGLWVELLDWYATALSAGTRPPEHAREEGEILHGTAVAHHNLGDTTQALAFYKRALRARRVSGDRAGLAATLNNIGTVYRSGGEYDRALRFYRRALCIRRELGDTGGVATTLNALGYTEYRRGMFRNAMQAYEETLQLRRATGDELGEAITLNNIGLLHHTRRQYADALQCYETSLMKRRELGDVQGQAVCLNCIGSLLHDSGRYEEALQSYGGALAIRRLVGARRAQADTLYNMSLTYVKLGAISDAVSTLEQAVLLRDSVDHDEAAVERAELEELRATMQLSARGSVM